MLTVDPEPVLHHLAHELDDILAEMSSVEQRFASICGDLPPAHRESASNLLHYLILRRRDVRELQTQLTMRGLSSLGRAEAQVRASVEVVRHAVRRLTSSPAGPDAGAQPAVDFEWGRARLEANSRALLGPPPAGRDVRIMVTLPAEAADDPGLVRAMLESGMDCARINCAHDDAAAWDRMLGCLARAREGTGRSCRVLMDMAGPKLRTGPMQPGPAVIKCRPTRDVYGRVSRPARIWLTRREAPQPAPEPATATLPVAGDWISRLRIGDTITLVDAREAKRTIRIVGRTEAGAWGEAVKTMYLTPGTRLRIGRHIAAASTDLGPLPVVAQAIVVARGDRLILRRDQAPGVPAIRGPEGVILQPASIGVTLPEIFDDVRPDESIWLDDGKIGGVIQRVEHDWLELAITHARPAGSKLLADKGINLPDSALRVPALTAKDLEDLRFIAAHADMVGYSFVRDDADVRALQAHLADLGARSLGLLLKIETRRAFANLPMLLLAALSSPAAGVMIARGDLAVECGYERLAEVQEEILWMAEASHLPVIWATQVLETLAKDGVPSRAEITDAAMGERAECVMLNKGPYILDAVRVLDDILTRMQAHQQKKRAMLRRLDLAERFLAG